MPYAIPVDELSLSKIEQFRTNAQAAAFAMAQKLGLVSNINQLIFREALPATDLGQPVGTGYGAETYITGPAVINTWTSVYNTAAVPTIPRRTIVVFYKITDEAVAPAAAAVRFREGATGASTKGIISLEQFINIKLTAEVYLSTPIVYGPDERPFIEFYPRAAVAAGERLGFGCFIAEPSGGNVS
jgi:hypothetical protein